MGGGLKAPTSRNRYAHALDNPTTFSDPSGLSPVLSVSTPFDAYNAQQAASSAALAFGIASGTLLGAAALLAKAPGPLADILAVTFGFLGAELAVLGGIFAWEAGHDRGDAGFWNASNLSAIGSAIEGMLIRIFAVFALVSLAFMAIGQWIWAAYFGALAASQIMLMIWVQADVNSELAALPAGASGSP